MAYIKETARLLAKAAVKWRQDKAERLAAALAYYSMFSLAPLLMLGLSLAGRLAERKQMTDFIMFAGRHLMGAKAAEALVPILEGGGRPHGSATLIGLVTFFFGSSGFFVHLQDSFNTVWQTSGRPRHWLHALLLRRLLSFAFVLAVAAGLLSAGPALSLLVSRFGRAPWVAFALSLVLETLLFAALFKTLPETRVHWGDVWRGSVLTALLFTAAQSLIGYYLGRLGSRSLYGAAGAVLALLFWIYVSAQILLFGAEFVQVTGARRSGRGH